MTARLPLVLLAVLALPFVPFWPDYEQARRALMVALACGLAIACLAVRKAPLDLTAAGTTWLLLAVCGLLPSQPWSDPIHAIYLPSLYAAFVLGTYTSADSFARAGCWVGSAAAALGTAQALGLAWPAELVTTATPVATFGNLNVASEVVAVAASGALVLLAQARRPTALAATVVLFASYLWLNGSRSGLLALGLATLVVLAGKGTRKPLLLASIALGLGIGWTLDRCVRTLPQEAPSSARTAPAGRLEPLAKPSTLTVRKELWLGALAMATEAPVLGHGAGTFRAVYPRFRREGELEASTFGRQFLARVESAHHDLLEIFAERGVLGLLLMLWFALLSFRSGLSQSLGTCAPLVAFAALAMVRSPLGNAPAAFLLFGYVGTPTSNAAKPIFTEAQVPFVGPFTGAESLRTPVNRYIFNVRASYFAETDKIIGQMVNLGLTKIAVFYQNDDYGRAGLAGVERAVKKRNLGISVTGTVERNTVDVAAAVKAIAATEPQAVVMISAYKSCAAFIREMKKAGSNPQFINVSFVGSRALANELGETGRGVGITQVVPFPWNVGVPVVKEYQRLFAAATGKSEFSFTSLEGFIAAKVLVEGLRRTGPNLTRERFIATMDNFGFDTGGFTVSYTPDDHSGSRFVELTVITKEGKFLR